MPHRRIPVDNKPGGFSHPNPAQPSPTQHNTTQPNTTQSTPLPPEHALLSIRNLRLTPPVPFLLLHPIPRTLSHSTLPHYNATQHQPNSFVFHFIPLSLHPATLPSIRSTRVLRMGGVREPSQTDADWLPLPDSAAPQVPPHNSRTTADRLLPRSAADGEASQEHSQPDFHRRAALVPLLHSLRRAVG